MEGFQITLKVKQKKFLFIYYKTTQDFKKTAVLYLNWFEQNVVVYLLMVYNHFSITLYLDKSCVWLTKSDHLKYLSIVTISYIFPNIIGQIGSPDTKLY